MSYNTIQLKVSVDTSELDKLEEQLTHIKQLMQDVGIKVRIKPERSNDFFIAGSGNYFIKDAVIKDAIINSPKIKFSAPGDVVFSSVLAIGEVEQDINAQLADVASQVKQNTITIAELIRVRQADHQAWSEAVNRTWCSQK